MKTFLTASLLCFTLVALCQEVDCVPENVSASFDSADIVFAGKVIEIYELKGETVVNLIITSQFKGPHPYRNCLIINKGGNCRINFLLHDEYLVFGQKVDQFHHQTNYASGTKKLSHAQGDISDLSNNVPCEYEEVENKQACFRILAPVCGCNGVTYANACEAMKSGINEWRVSKCNN